jgi:glycosyltransferase involved in cell wall biosynthesis
MLVPKADAEGVASALEAYADNPALLSSHGAAGRQRVESSFSLDAMVRAYTSVYDAAARPVAR